MNLPTFAVILEDHILGRVYGASKVIHVINEQINDESQHIDATMTGRDISNIYKSLGYQEQSLIANTDLFDESETNIIVNQLELLNTASNSESRMSETLRDLVVLFAATLLVVLSAGITLVYYTSAHQNNAVVHSKVFAVVGTVIDKISPGV